MRALGYREEQTCGRGFVAVRRLIALYTSVLRYMTVTPEAMSPALSTLAP